MMRKRGFTLLEILIVVAIVALLAALMFPVYALARKSGYRATCTENLRQVGVAITLYESDFDAMPPSLDVLKKTGQLISVQIVKCPVDPVGGFGSRIDGCHKLKHDFPQSYETIFGWISELKAKLAEADPNHGIVACRLHADRAENYDLGVKHFCDYAWHMYEGLVLRLRKDGSVQSAQFRLHRKMVGKAVYQETATIWELFTDAQDPDARTRAGK